MFSKILIANRGEIACRVIRTARRLGIRTVAVYSDADAAALHVREADEAYRIGPPPARESYLVAEAILEAARRSGAEAVHPGYGFLSENAGFAEACAAAGIVFIGPPPAAIRAMGSKSAAKALMETAGVPLVPGYHGADQSPDLLAREAGRIGFPVLIKASAGGGGKGMRIVTSAGELQGAIASAKREAAASFGDDQVLIEKYLTRPRHIEIQVFADSQGNVLHLFERDCSIQRRHQKVIEEAPAPGMAKDRRAEMGRAAIAAARAIGYVGAGTVEFIAEGDEFYFMEMNTRLQVEHPVTEMITGQDLVEWQLLVAAGRPMPRGQDELAITGHAIEVRVYAEEPARDFRPSIGRLTVLEPPASGRHVRVDTGVRAGDAVTVYYDPMIAKLIVWDEDRPAAIRRLRGALAGYRIAGVETNLRFLQDIACHPAFAAGELDTGFIPRHHEALFPPPAAVPKAVLAGAVLSVLLERRAASERQAAVSGDPWSPWATQGFWQPGGGRVEDMVFGSGEATYPVALQPVGPGGYALRIADAEHEMCGELLPEGDISLLFDGVRRRLGVAVEGKVRTLFLDGTSYRLELLDPLAPPETEAAGGGHLMAPMPGKITQVMVAAGTVVERGAALIVLEAMKMEHTISAPAAGVVEEVKYAVGDLVEEGAELLTLVVEAAAKQEV